MGTYVDNHLASRCYLDGFTDHRGLLMVRGTYSPKPRLDKPSNVGYRKKWWGEDEGLRAAAERRLQVVEGPVAAVLRSIRTHGLPTIGTEQRELLLQFFAMHLVRTPGWRELIFTVRERELRARGHDLPGHESVANWVRSDRFWVDAVLRQIPQIAGVLGCTHWDLVEFDYPLLLTSDEPLVQVPFTPARGRAKVSGPRPALLGTLESRFVLDPRRAIIMSWLDEPEAAGLRGGDRKIAADLNLSVGARTDLEIFWQPGTSPPLVCPPWQPACAPISGRYHDGYGTYAAQISTRRRHAARLLSEVIRSDVTNEVRTIRLVPLPTHSRPKRADAES